MGLFGRFLNILGAKFSKLLGRAERPDELLDYSYEQMQEQLVEVKRGVANVVTAKKRIEIQANGVRDNVLKLETQAREAMSANREDLAQQAVERKVFAQQQLQNLDAQVEKLQTQQEGLINSQQNLETKIENFRSTKEVIKARYSAAKAQVQIGEAATGIGRGFNNAGMAIGRAQEQTENLEARAGALEELTAAGALEDFTSTGTQLDHELAAIKSSAAVKSEMDQLRAELGTGNTAKVLETAKS